MYICTFFPGYPDDITKFITQSFNAGAGITPISRCISVTYTPIAIKYGFPVSAISAAFGFFHN
jgi:hypothetical protein